VRRLFAAIGLAVTLAMGVAPARAQPDVRADGVEQTLACQGGDATVQGNGDRVVLSGACRSLELRGDGDHVELGIQPGGRILVEGNGDQVRYHLLGEGAVTVTIRGEGSTVGNGALPASAPASGTADIRGNGLDRVVQCGEAGASLQGNANHIVFRGACRSLDLRGEDDRVEVELAPDARIHLEGNRDRVDFRLPAGAAPPQVLIRGEGSTVTQAGLVAPPVATREPVVHAPPPPRVVEAPRPPPHVAETAPPAPRVVESAPSRAQEPVPAGTGPIVLSGAGQSRDVDCTGRDVQIEGDGGRFTLRGGCHSLAIQGNKAQVKAELMPGVPLTVQGDDDEVTYTLSRPGPDPAVWVKGLGSNAQKG